MDRKIKLLFVDDEEEFLHPMAQKLKERDLAVWAYTNGRDALEMEDDVHFDVALIDLELPKMKGGELLIKLKEKDPMMEVIILTGFGTINSAAECSRHGAFDYLLKPCSLDQIIESITKAYSERILKTNKRHFDKVKKVMENAIGFSPMEILECLRKIDKEDGEC